MPEPVTAYPLPYNSDADFYPYGSEANIYLLTDTWSCPSPCPYRTFCSLVLLVESRLEDCAVTYFVPTCADGDQLSWTAARSWISVIQSTRMSSTGISAFQRAMLLDIALAFFGFANQHPDLRSQDLYLLSSALIEAAIKLSPRERVDTHLYNIARMARREFPASIFKGVDIPAINEGLSHADIQSIFHCQRELVLRDHVVFAGNAERLAARMRSCAESSMSDERVIALLRRVWVNQSAQDDADDYDDMPELVNVA